MSYIPYTVGSNIVGIHLSPSAAKFKTVQISCYRIVLSLLLYNQIQTVHIAMSTDSAHCYVYRQCMLLYMSTDSVPVVIPDKINKVSICLSRTKPTFFLFYRQCTLLCLQTVHIATCTDSTYCYVCLQTVHVAMPTDSAHCYVYRQCTLLCVQTVYIAMSTDSAHCYAYRQCILLCLQTVHIAMSTDSARCYVYRQCTLLCLQTVHVAIYVYRQCACGYT